MSHHPDDCASEPEDRDCGISAAYYDMLPGGSGQPTLECACGEQCQGDTWEEAGMAFDEHRSEDSNVDDG